MKASSPRTTSTPSSPSPSTESGDVQASFAATLLRWGWWSLLIFLSLGLVLEALHGFKVGYYLNLNNETRRLMWTLAHAHGTLLSIVLIVFALTTRSWTQWNSSKRVLASRCLQGALILIPGGFFLGGFDIKGGDPGLGILLVPIGGALLFIGVLLTALQASKVE